MDIPRSGMREHTGRRSMESGATTSDYSNSFRNSRPLCPKLRKYSHSLPIQSSLPISTPPISYIGL